MAEPYVGARKEIAFTPESVRGTSETHAAGDWQPHLGFDFKAMVDKVKDDPAMGRIEDNIDHEVVHRSSGGGVPLRLTKQFLPNLFAMIFGHQPTPSSLGGGLYQRDYVVQNNNQHQAFTVTVKDPIAGMKKYALGMLNTAGFEFNLDEITKATLDIQAGKEEAGTGTPAYDTSYDVAFFMPTQIEFKFADDVAGLAAASETYLSNLSLQVNKNAIKEYALGEEGPIDVVNQRFGLAGSLEMTYETTVLRDYAHNRTKKAVQIKLTDADGVYVQIQLPQVGFEDWSEGNDNNAYLKNTIAFFAERNNTSGMALATVVNTES